MHIGLSSGQCKPLYCQGYQVGLVRKDVEEAIKPFKDVFSISTSQIDIMPTYNHVAQTKSTFEEISKNIDNVLQSLRDSPDHDFLALKGWRNECYNVRPSFSSPPLFKMERSATCKITSSNMSRSFCYIFYYHFFLLILHCTYFLQQVCLDFDNTVSTSTDTSKTPRKVYAFGCKEDQFQNLLGLINGIILYVIKNSNL